MTESLSLPGAIQSTEIKCLSLDINQSDWRSVTMGWARSIFSVSLVQLQSHLFLQGILVPFRWKWCLEANIWGLWVLIATVLLFSQAPPMHRARRYLYIYWSMHRHICILSLCLKIHMSSYWYLRLHTHICVSEPSYLCLYSNTTGVTLAFSLSSL